ncbi:MAG TPA: TonB family protein [Bryobacteraceae bacterium]
MRLRLLFAFLCALTLIAQDSSTSGDWRRWLNRGIEEYKSARYQDAAEYFQKSISLNPNELAPHLYLATAWMTQYIPGAGSPENLDMQHNAETEFKRVLELDSKNLTALQSLASLNYQAALGLANPEEKTRKLDESAAWYQRVLAVDPRDSVAYYSLGVIDWLKWYPNLMRARAQLGMRPEQPGPLSNAAVRQDLQARYSVLISDGIANLDKALEIDPHYSDAMAYMNLFIRERADLLSTPAEYRRDIDVADQWVQKAIAAKKSGASTASSSYAPAPPPPPPPPPPPVAGSRQTPQRIQVAGNMQQANLIRKVDPVYPPLAEQARIQGVVRFSAIIGKDGSLQNLSLISGHPLLLESARQAVKQWVYRPTLLNGEPVEVVTTIDVDFALNR